jgi:hypothetical protein
MLVLAMKFSSRSNGDEAALFVRNGQAVGAPKAPALQCPCGETPEAAPRRERHRMQSREGLRPQKTEQRQTRNKRRGRPVGSSTSSIRSSETLRSGRSTSDQLGVPE